MSGLVRQVANRRHPASDLPLVSGVPLRYISRLWIQRHVDIHAGGREERLAVLGVWIATGIALPRIGEAAHRIHRVDIGADRRVGGFPLVEPGFDDVVEDGAAYPEGVAAVAVRIPDQTDARSKVRLLGVPHGVGNSRVAFEEQSGRGIRIDFAELTGMKRGLVETRPA